jgi:DNA-binding transcriptional regulator YiaG
MKSGNRKKLPPFRRMEAIEYRKSMRAMNWRQGEVATRFGLGKRTVRRHANGEARIDGPSTALMRLMVEGIVSPDELARAMAGLYPIKGTRAGRAKRRALDAGADSAQNPRP